jgi:PAS domain S-box-containing protein
MQRPAYPANEIARLKDLFSHELLDTAPDEFLDSVTHLAQKVFHVKTVLISLIDANRQWFKSRQGLDASETPRDISFCGHVILQDEIFEISDALEDQRFAHNPLVTGNPLIRFYVGIPIKSARGNNLGTLCMIDDHPRTLTQEERAFLVDFKNIIQTYIINQHQNKTFQLIMDSVQEGIIVHDRSGRIVFINPAAHDLLGDSLMPMFGQSSWTQGQESSKQTSSDMDEVNDIMIALHREVLPHEGQTVLTKVDGQKVQVHFQIEPLIRGGILTNTILVLQTD